MLWLVKGRAIARLGGMEEDVSSLSDDDDDGVGLGLAVSSESQDTNPGGAGKRKVLHPEGR